MKTIFLGIIGTLLGLSSINAFAETSKDLILGVHLVSYHDRGNYNNQNPGLYINYDGWTGGIYYNSYKKTSAYFGYTFQKPTPNIPLIDSIDLSIGLVSGYPVKIEGTQLSPLFIPSFKIGITDDIAMRVIYMPKVGKINEANVLHLTLERKF